MFSTAIKNHVCMRSCAHIVRSVEYVCVMRMVSRISSWTKPVLPANPLRTILEVRQRWEPPRIHAQGSGLLSESKRVAAVPRLRVHPLQLGATREELRVLLAVGQAKSTHLRSRLFEGKSDAQPGDESSRPALGPGRSRVASNSSPDP